MQSAVARIEQELAPGERVLWTGQPRRGIRFTRADFFLIPFSLAWLAFAIFWTVMAFRIPRAASIPALNVLFPLFGIPFIVVGLYLTVGRFWFEARRRARTYYAITSHRIIAFVPSDRGAFQFLDLQHLDAFSVSEQSKDVGTIAFTPSTIRSFDQIANVREVEAILRRAHASSRAMPT